MDSGATEREILEKKLEKRLQDPKSEPLISLPLDFLKDITCGFSTERELGRGGCGVVYKGVLRSGKAIAVKKIFDAHLLGNENQVKNEIICLTEVRHQNVVQFVGYCVETKLEVVELSGKHVMAEKYACLLCFEFLCNGSLDKHLSDDTLGLDWDKRYKIIRGVCRGLHYLHVKRHIVHRDLKPQNILMDETMMPKIADFGLSRLLGEQKSKTVTANSAGTLGYMAQEYIDHGIISSKADIFSLGVIIIEIIKGCRDYPNISETTETSLKHYTDEVVGSWRNRLIEITPMHMSLEMCIQQVQQCISIALKCLEPESNKRPTSLDIVQSLNAVEPKCTSPRNPPSVVEKDSRNQNLHETQVNVNIINIPKTISAINALNECANLFQWVTSAISSPKLQLNEIQKEKLHGDVRQLQRDLQCLSDSLPAMYNLIDRAEWRIHDHYVAELLSILKHAVYDAEDILDEFRWYETKLSVEGNSISVEPVIDFFHSVTQGSFNEVTDIQKRLNHLSGQLEKMGLLQAVPRFDRSFRPETTSYPTEAKIFGRDEEKNKLITLLGVPTNNSAGPSGHKRKRSGVCSSANNQIYATIDTNEATVTSVPVLPIVGIGGVGKTTLAQDICNHSKVKRHFHLIIWICVSDDFDVKRLTKEVIEQSSGEVPKNDNLNFLQGAVANSLNTKRFLIVLDDMWDENEMDWKRFCAPFRNVLKGSMMLVTTRSPKVAHVVRTMDPFPLEGLNQDVFREFFKLCVFGSDTSNNYIELERIGEKILPKLKGSPLAAKTLGRLLGMRLDLAHWDRILKSQLWELRQEETDILPALRLSYMYLPSYLKRCFSFCAVYPKDYNFRKKDLAEIWAAEGLVEHQYTGDQYFEELAHLSFFQKYPRSHEKYVIHDLMHDMAQLVSKDECFIVKEKNDLPKIPQNVRHLLVLNGGGVKCSDLLKHDMAQHRKLRTLLCGLSLKSKTGNTIMEKWCTELLCMRVMVCSSISEWGLPGSISNMKHLRYLKILDSRLCKKLPATFCHLYNMQILYAAKWEIDDIPSGFGMLINLQKFESVKCQFHHIHSVGILKGATDEGQRGQFKIENYNGESLPSWFHPQNSEQIHSYDRTKSTLLFLTDVEIADCRNLSSLEQFLQPVYMPIIMEIKISNCRNLESVPTDRFGYFRFLEVLSVSHCPKIKSRHLFAPSLKKLYLEDSGDLGYKIECSSLTIMHLSNCPLESIELQMCNLRLLQELKISSCPSLTVIRDSEPISSDILQGEARSRAIDHTFVSLTDVEITDCSNLSSQEQFLQPVYMPIIMEIKISNCRNLESVPTDRFGNFRFLEVLSVSHCPKIKSRHLFVPSLKKLYLEDSGDLGYKIECSSLTIMHLSNCPLESIELQMCNLRLLQELKISSCPSLTVIRDSEPISSDILQGEARSRAIDHTFVSLTDVEITDCSNLSSQEQFLQPVYMPIILEIKISNCRNLESVPTDRFGYFRFLEVLSVSHCPKIKSRHLFAPSLKKLYLEDSGDLGYKIECSSLTIMHLSNCPLESIELQMCNLRLLQELKISSCPSLTVIRDSEPISSDILQGEARSRAIDHTFVSLTDVEITDCSNLSSQEQFLQPVYMPIIMEIKISNCRNLESVPTDRFGNFRFLEVLSVSHCPKIKSRHLFVPSLKKLYLEDSGDLGYKIECSSLTIMHLSNCPLESIELQMCNLRLLQELKISSCPSLTVIRDSEPISSDILQGEARSRAIDHTFVSLTDVEITDCSNLSSQEQFLQPVYMPIILEIKISNCRNLESVPTDRFGYFRFLEVLSVSHCPKIKSRHLFAPSLKKLYLEDSGDLGYKIECSSLTIMHLSNCPLESIELQMWNLRLLQELKISSCPSLTVIRDSEPISSDILQGEARSRAIDNTFVSLTDVEITDCRNLSSQEQFLQPGYVPMIKKIEISNCRSLESVPTKRFGYFRFLEVLSVSHCPKIKSRHLFVPSLKKLYLEDSGDLGYKIECSSLTIMHLSNCPLESIELQMCNLRLLQELKISSCPSLTVIRDSEPISSDILQGEARSRAIDHTFVSLTDVEITDCSNLSSQEQFLQPVYMPIIMEIKISNCRNLESVPTDRFGYFRFLEVLSVSHCPKIKSRHLFAPSLKKLYLEDSGDLGYKIECSSLTIMHLSNCPLESIELQMWNLRLLQELKISSCPSLTVIRDSEPISSDILQGEARSRAIDNTFVSLTDVEITDCRNLSSQEQFLQPGYVPMIKKIEISNCRSLESVPTKRFGYFRFLEVLSVSHCPKIKSRHLFAPSLKKLYLEDSGNLVGNIDCSSLTILHLSNFPLESIELQVRNLPLLQQLKISSCESLTIIRDSEPISTDLFHEGAQSRMGKSPFVTHLTIELCKELKTIDDLLYLPAIERICIMFCGLLSLPTNRLGSFPLLKDLEIINCSSLDWQSGMLLPSSLQKLKLSNCGDFSAWFPSCLENLTSLKSLQISYCECIFSVPSHLWSSNLKSLQTLQFFSCSKLKSIGGPDAIAHTENLYIDYCPELKEIDQPLSKGTMFCPF